MNENVTVTYVNSNGEGFAQRVEVPAGTTIDCFVSARTGELNSSTQVIRVNRDIVARDYVLKEGDRIVVTPTNIKGA
jgi:sulfur carrier protein ThiS